MIGANGMLAPAAAVGLVIDAVAVYAVLLDGAFRAMRLKTHLKTIPSDAEAQRRRLALPVRFSADLAEILAKIGVSAGIIFAIPEFTLGVLSKQSAIPGFFVLSAAAVLLPAFAAAAGLRLSAGMAVAKPYGRTNCR
ncbi:MAG: hypothetical protein PHI85_01080 [Victivallaceae bacterium]|nr:hypothetical protein [Victivallaceae bacterium]